MRDCRMFNIFVEIELYEFIPLFVTEFELKCKTIDDSVEKKVFI